LPDGEIIAGTPIPAIVPLPGKAMAPMPGKVTVCPSSATEASDDDDQGDAKPAAPAVGSLALVTAAKPTATPTAA
jgi:hypothetical protein